MKSKEVLVAVCICGLALVGAFAWQKHTRFRARRTHCISTLRQISSAILMYGVDYDDAFTLDIKALRHYGITAEILICPRGVRKPGAMANPDEWMDYIYVYWPDEYETPKHYPMMYDRRR